MGGIAELLCGSECRLSISQTLSLQSPTCPVGAPGKKPCGIQLTWQSEYLDMKPGASQGDGGRIEESPLLDGAVATTHTQQVARCRKAKLQRGGDPTRIAVFEAQRSPVWLFSFWTGDHPLGFRPERKMLWKRDRYETWTLFQQDENKGGGNSALQG